MDITWEKGSEIKFRIEEGTGVISGNREGLISLAAHLTVLAGEETGSHIHFDEHNSLEDGSDELIIEKTE